MPILILTDFGTRDPYVASMKGVIASRTEIAIHDLTHEIAPFDVFEAAWFLRTVWMWWPKGSIFVAVVDPGVGTSRRILVGRRDDRLFIAPDNGVLTFVEAGEVVAVEREDLYLPDGSDTFHGRDRFAPIAAALANGFAYGNIGPTAGEISRLPYRPPSYASDSAEGSVVAIDRFGNCVTDLARNEIAFETFRLYAGKHSIGRTERTYASSPDPGPFLLIGSSGLVEISVANGSAAEALGVRRGDAVRIVKT